MIFGKSLKPDVMIRVGFVFMILGSLWRLLVHPNSFFTQNLIDGVMGLLYGICIGFLLVGIWRKNRASSTSAGGPHS
jgi:hypothetical protein